MSGREGERPVDMALWGLDEGFAGKAAEYPELTVGRVVSQEKGVYRVIHALGEQSAAVSGRYRHGVRTVSDYPAAGDFVMLQTGDGCGDAVIHALLPRKSVFIRKAAGTANSEQVVAANVDRVFICMALNSDFNLRRLERYLTVAWDSGAVPVVVLTKADLCGDIQGKLSAVSAVAAGVEVAVTSSVGEGGHESVLPYLAPGRTVALLGSSGVGKSTLLNLLLGEERVRTGGLRNDGRGRHTTTHRELRLLPDGGIIVDTPGMRELGLWDASGGIEKTFGDIEELALACRFKNCCHEGEPGCAVRAALESGALPAKRWASYQKLQAENAYSANSESYLASKEQKFKDIARRNKSNRKK